MLSSVRVENYRSIVNSGYVELNQEMTTLVGGNEAGKTNFLKAITLLGNSEEIPRSELCDYNSNDLEEESISDIMLLEVEFPAQSLTNGTGLSPFGRRKFVRNEDGEKMIVVEKSEASDDFVTVRRYADGTHRISFDSENKEEKYLTSLIYNRVQRLERQITVDQISSELGTRTRQLRRFAREENRSNGDFKDKLTRLQNYIRENNEIITDQYDQEDGNSDRNAEKLVTEITGIVDSYRDNENILIFDADLRQLPEIYYFGEIVEIKDEIELEKLKQNPEENPAYAAILSYAGLEPKELEELSSGEIRDRRQRAGEDFSELFNEYWEQSEIDIEIELSGGRVSLQFYDESEKRKAPSDRSRGLRRFVSFLAQVITQSESHLENAIVLLDDPGVHLHPEGHKNLRNALKELAKDNQLVFSTHSPYMLDTNNLSGIRVVNRRSYEDGTKITRLGIHNTASDDTLAPVRASLGATFSDSLFSSSQTVLVEGVEDRLYLNSFSRFFDKVGEGESFANNIQIIDCGGASKTTYMGRLVAAENYDYIVFLDGDEAGNTAYNQLVDDKISEENVMMVSDILDTEDEVSVEDLFARNFFVKIVSDVHDISEEELLEELPESEGNIIGNLNSCVKRIEKTDQDGLLLRKKEIAEEISDRLLNEYSSSDDLGNGTTKNFSEVISIINHRLNNTHRDDGSGRGPSSSGDGSKEAKSDEENTSKMEKGGE